MTWVLALVWGCSVETVDTDMSVDEVAAYVRSDVPDPLGWAADVHAALQAAERPVEVGHVCQVLAVIEQESGYAPDPEVSGLAEIARGAIEDKLTALGPLADAGSDWLLSPVAAGADESFDARLDRVRTEGELDTLFQDLAAHHAAVVPELPVVDGWLDRRIERLNPVTTAGSMQVSVRGAPGSWATTPQSSMRWSRPANERAQGGFGGRGA